MKTLALALLTLSAVSFAKGDKVDVDTDMVAVRGLHWNLEYFIDKKAKLCFAVRGQALTTIPCRNLKAYPQLKKIIRW